MVVGLGLRAAQAAQPTSTSPELAATAQIHITSELGLKSPTAHNTFSEIARAASRTYTTLTHAEDDVLDGITDDLDDLFERVEAGPITAYSRASRAGWGQRLEMLAGALEPADPYRLREVLDLLADHDVARQDPASCAACAPPPSSPCSPPTTSCRRWRGSPPRRWRATTSAVAPSRTCCAPSSPAPTSAPSSTTPSPRCSTASPRAATASRPLRPDPARGSGPPQRRPGHPGHAPGPRARRRPAGPPPGRPAGRARRGQLGGDALAARGVPGQPLGDLGAHRRRRRRAAAFGRAALGHRPVPHRPAHRQAPDGHPGARARRVRATPTAARGRRREQGAGAVPQGRSGPRGRRRRGRPGARGDPRREAGRGGRGRQRRRRPAQGRPAAGDALGSGRHQPAALAARSGPPAPPRHPHQRPRPRLGGPLALCPRASRAPTGATASAAARRSWRGAPHEARWPGPSPGTPRPTWCWPSTSGCATAAPTAATTAAPHSRRSSPRCSCSPAPTRSSGTPRCPASPCAPTGPPGASCAPRRHGSTSPRALSEPGEPPKTTPPRPPSRAPNWI